MSDVVDKALAWDAATAIPRKTQAELERLRAENERLRAALGEIADGASWWRRDVIADAAKDALAERPERN